MILIKLLLGISFLLIFFQDNKNREVYWFLFPLVAVFCGILFYVNTLFVLFLNALVLNCLFVLILIIIIGLYSRLKLKTSILKTIGLGDILLFFALTFSFSTIAFIIFFISALIFSLGLHVYRTKNMTQNTTVPLAGYMSLFFLMAYTTHWLGFVNILYKI